MNTHDLENPQETPEEGQDDNTPPDVASDGSVSETIAENSDVESTPPPISQIPVESENVEPEETPASQFPPGHLDIASKVREPNEQEKIVGTILDEFEKIDEVAGETGFKLEAAIAKEEILHGDDADNMPTSETTSDKPVWKTEAEQRYEAQQARKQQMLEDRRRLDEERRQKQEAFKARMKADREVYESEMLQEKADQKAQMISEREAADARLRAEREAKRRARELYEAQQRGEVLPEPEQSSINEIASAPTSAVLEPETEQQELPPPIESPRIDDPAEREREAMNRLGKPTGDDGETE
ncbi:MAG: hypothetical protein KC615_17065 [Anaerolineae bacterium]|nr:hypothetical protein [Anaerolineae bacterium]